MGRVLGHYGVKGWIKAQAYTGSPGALLDYDEWWLALADSPDAWQSFRVLGGRCHSHTLLAQLAGIASREEALRWRGARIGVPRAALPETAVGEHYWNDLVDLTVINRAGETLGKVVGLIDTGVHPVLRVAPDDALKRRGEERLIPLVAAYVDAIDVVAGQIIVDWKLEY
jgi:16S rRNA processing protein RimM